METTITVSNGVNDSNMMHISPRRMNRESLNDYYIDNGDFCSSWAGIHQATIEISGEIREAIYVGTAGTRNCMEDYFYLPVGNAWASTSHGEITGQIIGHATITNQARCGIQYAADWRN